MLVVLLPRGFFVVMVVSVLPGGTHVPWSNATTETTWVILAVNRSQRI